ncbi:PREDICTED: mediator of RNA polymerase II transcription subunit 15a isoform X2 [Tarenaya hassleriana]|uniref:mediator of RNA polymerase II transcription subunit 15a isoform X2 n=1 Tax=Tarenaya hassleriana TaxID=28532 RepID=UPI00053C4562|nr:PREDICTED: mediator of RNA polymerase II transcription subunit 15a isoform X2 [Tarenaya hassleriana]
MVWRPPVLDRARDDDHNWRVRLPPGSRLTIVTRIAETIDRCISFSVPVNELRRIAARFEERVYRNAVDQVLDFGIDPILTFPWLTFNHDDF